LKVLLTGGAGFLGKYVHGELEKLGHYVVPYDLADGGDVASDDKLRQRSAGCDHVIHLAGVLGTAELFDNPFNAVEVNVNGTLNVLRMCAERGMGYTGITMPQVWDNVYQATKMCAMSLAAAWNRHEGVPVSHVRAFNAYGIGQKVHGVQKIIPTFASLGWRGKPIPVWGDGNQRVDLVWAQDIARMLVHAMAWSRNEVFDAGTGEGTTVLDVARRVIERTGSRSQIEFLPMRKGEHPANVVAHGEGWDLMKWHPAPRMLELDETIAWYEVPRR
jgi:UDP-glucose 4-epimerase